jgi:hypothetical protein
MEMQAYAKCRHNPNSTTQLTIMLSLLSLPIYFRLKINIYREHSKIQRQFVKTFVKQNLGQRCFLAVPKRCPAVPFGTVRAFGTPLSLPGGVQDLPAFSGGSLHPQDLPAFLRQPSPPRECRPTKRRRAHGRVKPREPLPGRTGGERRAFCRSLKVRERATSN